MASLESAHRIYGVKQACLANSHNQVYQILEQHPDDRAVHQHLIKSECGACFRILIEVKGVQNVVLPSISNRNVASANYLILFEQYFSDYAGDKKQFPRPLNLVQKMLAEKRFDLLKFLIGHAPAAILTPKDSRACEVAVIKYALAIDDKEDAVVAFTFIWQLKNFRFLRGVDFFTSFKAAVRLQQVHPMAEILSRVPEAYAAGCLEEALRKQCPNGLIGRIIDKWPFAIAERLPSGETPFHVALQHSNEKIVRKMLEKWPDVHREKNQNNGWSSLHYAAVCQKPNVVRLLLEEYDADPFEEDFIGQNPLFKVISSLEFQELRLNERIDEIFRLLAPRVIQQDDVLRYEFHDIVFLLRNTQKSYEWPFLFDHCIEAFYGPEVNSKFHLIERLLETFPSKYRNRNYSLTIILHDLFDLKKIKATNFCDQYEKEEFIDSGIRALYFHRSIAFQSDDALEHYFVLVAELMDRFKGVKRLDKVLLQHCFIPPKVLQCQEVAKRMVQALDTVTRQYRLDLTFVGEKLFQNFSDRLEDFNVINLIETGCFAAIINFSQIRKLCDDKPENFEAIKPFLPAEIARKFDPNGEVPGLKHLARLQIRETIDKAAGGDIWKFLDAIKELPLPEKMKNYLRYLDEIMQK